MAKQTKDKTVRTLLHYPVTHTTDFCKQATNIFGIVALAVLGFAFQSGAFSADTTLNTIGVAVSFSASVALSLYAARMLTNPRSKCQCRYKSISGSGNLHLFFPGMMLVSFLAIWPAHASETLSLYFAPIIVPFLTFALPALALAGFVLTGLTDDVQNGVKAPD
jgi:hypothetical protein